MTLTQLLGQDRAVEIVQRALTSGRVHHGWIFHGPAGVGKATAALATARVLLCHGPTRGEAGMEPCGACESCRRLDSEASAHPDLRVVTKEQAGESDLAHLRGKKQFSIPVDLLRERVIGGWAGTADNKKYIEPVASKAPMLGHGRVFIVDEAELLDASAQNVLLKLLEEPPAGTHLFLVTVSEDQLLPTIRSRCQRVGFRRLDDAIVRQWVEEQAAASDAEVDADRMDAILTFARGSIGRAALALHEGLAEWQSTLERRLHSLASGRPDPDLGRDMADLVGRFADKQIEGRPNASKDAANKAAVRQLLGLLEEICRRRIERRSADLEQVSAEEAEAAIQPWLAGIDQAEQAERHLDANVAPVLLLDNLAVQWAAAVARES